MLFYLEVAALRSFPAALDTEIVLQPLIWRLIWEMSPFGVMQSQITGLFIDNSS